MSATTKVSSSPSIRDPSTNQQRPTSAKMPDVTHILSSVFGELYSKDVLSSDIIKNLTVSSDVDDEYHKKYVNKLKEAQLVKENRIQEYAMLEKHILEARAKALAYEERETVKRNQICENPDLYGLPAVKSYFSYCLDDALLKEHGLLVPSDYYYKQKRPFITTPRNKNVQNYLNETVASKVRSKKMPVLPPIQTNRTPRFDEIDELHKSGSEVSDNPDNDDDAYNSDQSNSDSKAAPYWKNTPGQEERQNDRETLKFLNKRTNFLPNPRLNAARNATFIDNAEKVFEVTPSVILYEKYNISKVYESSFEIRNTSTIAHQFRVIPPKTQYFSLSLGQYPQNHSIIAPGLAALFNVRFAPDSLCSYEDEILIECSNGSKLTIPLAAKRESPCLSIGSVINCGHSLAGQIKGCRFIIENEGGDGRFVIFPKSSWPATTFKTNVLSSSLYLYPFEIQPSIFELRKGEWLILEVIFKPPDVKTYEQDIVIACDNCTINEYKLIGEGQLAQVEFSSFDESENYVPVDQYKDVLSNKIVRFPSTNPNVLTSKSFRVKNLSSCPIDFSWLIYKPIMESQLHASTNTMHSSLNADQAHDDHQSGKHLYVIDKDTLFSVTPRQGTLDRDETKWFNVQFSPNKVGYYLNVAHLVLHGIPEINKQIMLDSNDELHPSVLNREDLNTTDFITTVIELRGECEPFKFMLDPPAIFLPGSIYMQSTARKSFRLINMSNSPINFKWKPVLEPHILQVEPSFGEIAPRSYALMDVLITGIRPDKIIEDVTCYVDYSDDPVSLHVEAEIKGPEAQLKEAAVDFGLVKIGDRVKSYVTLENVSNLPLNWTLTCSEHNELFRFVPHGTLRPLEVGRLEIEFLPTHVISLNVQFEIDIQDGNKIVFNCHAQGQVPTASFLNSIITLDELYLNVDRFFEVTICNHTVLSADFTWGEPFGRDVESFEIQFEHQQGSIMSKSNIETKLRIKAHKLGPIDDLRIPCLIADAPDPIFLSILGEVKGVSVEMYLSDDDKAETSTMQLINNTNAIDFGSVKVGDLSERYLCVKNLSGIKTTVSLQIRRFQAVESSPDGGKFSIPGESLRRNMKLKDRYRLADNVNGVGFALPVTSFTLSEFSLVSCPIYVLAEIWGSYDDVLIVGVDGVDREYQVPLAVEVIGAPLKFYTGKVLDDEDEEISMLRFGSQMQGKESITRKLQIQNTSHIPVEIEWKSFLTDPNDNKLIDINLVYHDIKVDDSTPSSDRDISRNESSSCYVDRIQPLREKTLVKESITSLNMSENEYVYSTHHNNPPIVRLCLTPHYGLQITPDNQVFYLNQYKTVLKPRERAAISITFNLSIEKCQTYEAFFVGYLKLPQNLTEGDGFKRKISFEKEPVRFKVTGTLESPNLVVEYDNEDLNFISAFGDLIERDQTISSEKLYHNQISLLNNSLAPIEFDLSLSKPFYFSNLSNQTGKYTLKSKSKIKVPVVFKLDTDLMLNYRHVTEDHVVLQDNLNINYTKHARQLVPMQAKIYSAAIKVSKTSLNFGKCLVNQERCQHLIIKNPSNSSVLWNISIKNDPKSVFKCDVTDGLLEVDKLTINKFEKLINVFFTAKDEETYNSKLIITLRPSARLEPIVIDLNGSGTFDQKSEAILNV